MVRLSLPRPIRIYQNKCSPSILVLLQIYQIIRPGANCFSTVLQEGWVRRKKRKKERERLPVGFLCGGLVSCKRSVSFWVPSPLFGGATPKLCLGVRRRETETRRGEVLAYLVVAVIVGVVILVAAAPCILQAALNRVARHAPYPVSAEAQNLHQSLTIADLHTDSLLWNRDLLRRHKVGHIDLPRLEAGNAAVQVFAASTKFPGETQYRGWRYNINVTPAQAVIQRWPPATWRSMKARALYQAQKLDRFAARSEGRLHMIRTARDLDDFVEKRSTAPRIVGGILSIEGLHCLEGDLANLDVLFEAGFRMAGLMHFCDNEVGGASNGVSGAGLTAFGREVIARMEALPMIIDLAHASPQLIDDVLATANRPVLVSHTGVKGTCDNPRNVSDEHVQSIAASGGIIGIGYWRRAVGAVSLEAIARAMRHVADLVGVRHVALGSDFDGSVKIPFDASELPALTHHLLSAGFSHEDVGQIMGGNAIRFLRQGLPQA